MRHAAPANLDARRHAIPAKAVAMQPATLARAASRPPARVAKLHAATAVFGVRRATVTVCATLTRCAARTADAGAVMQPATVTSKKINAFHRTRHALPMPYFLLVHTELSNDFSTIFLRQGLSSGVQSARLPRLRFAMPRELQGRACKNGHQLQILSRYVAAVIVCDCSLHIKATLWKCALHNHPAPPCRFCQGLGRYDIDERHKRQGHLLRHKQN